jgi:hypothetical protein
MTLTATYDPVLSRIRLAGTLLGASATYAVFDRTVDGGITYTTVRGGASVPVASQNASVDDYEFPVSTAITYRVRSYSAGNVLQSTQTTGITQAITQPWLKVPAAPFLNQPVEIVDASEVTRPSRATLYDVVGRTNPVAVSDVSSSLRYSLYLLTRSAAAEKNLDYLFAAGEVVLLQLPANEDHVPDGYYSVGDVSRARTMRRSRNRVWTVPLVGVAEPGADVIGSAYTWQGVVADYATWSAVIAANADWNTLINHVSSPSDVIVP